MLVFVDMDGVVADFDDHIISTYNVSMEKMSPEQMSRFWDVECVSKRFFANSPVISEGICLVDGLLSGGQSLCFLTSTGGGLHHIDIAKQKLDFLQRIGYGHLPVVFATGTKCKADFAGIDCVLIDDRQKVVDAFTERGGQAYLFNRTNWESIVEDILK